MAFAPSATFILLSVRARLNMLKRGAQEHTQIAEVERGLHRGEGGLMGVALHPDFTQNGWLHVSFTTTSFLRTVNQVVRITMRDGRMDDRTVILDDLPGSHVQNGSRLVFGPDGCLYISAGDATAWDKAQRLDNLGGKILRMRDEGSIPNDNPYGPHSPLFAIGVRNPQGLAFDPVSGRLFETEHGPSGFEGRGGGGDEVNIIEGGKKLRLARYNAQNSASWS